MPIKIKDLKKALQSKGFVGPFNTHHQYYNYRPNGLQSNVRTKVSHGEKEIKSKRVVNEIKNQMKFDSSRDLYDFVRCTFTKEMYYNLIRDKGFLNK